MLATTRAVRPVLVQHEDRRAARRPYPEVVLVAGEPMTGRDISSSGVSVLLKPELALGDIVRVTLSGAIGSADEVGTAARVARIEAGPEGFVVGLQFIE